MVNFLNEFKTLTMILVTNLVRSNDLIVTLIEGSPSDQPSDQKRAA